MAQKVWERFTPAEAKQMEIQEPKLFSLYFERYKERLADRARTFEKHGRINSHGYQMIKSTLDITKETGVNAYNLSKMSQVLNSKWASYSNQRAIDRKIANSLNQHFGRNFINADDLDVFGRMMEILRDSPMFQDRGSDPIAEIIAEGLATAAKTVSNWRDLFRQRFGNEYIDSIMKE